ncbi:uncharacterized protein HMPREF1541_09884 [Cyphellophora europaea CBS 101466]|uniref:CENP-V/GFA domain-containing protein n=1 Tax=Cyphellophora europaea (strain CBS 101466) TaxID=1220924 RepID=W2SAF8_CYPE1|nr:uncharacterized protein HMPREF1541_09884 [Cyphellophora europaea CBS 101466]ETN45008.1 hypothetical protein HMPREF1541_09884 [Cyphellophora europaea CBS 101466]
MPQTFPGSCYCGEVQYKLTLDNPAEDARTSICVSLSLPARTKKIAVPNSQDWTPPVRSAIAFTPSRRLIQIRISPFLLGDKPTPPASIPTPSPNFLPPTPIPSSLSPPSPKTPNPPKAPNYSNPTQHQHCTNCKKFTGGPYGITTKLPRSTYTVTSSPPSLRKHTADNGSGVQLTREFCATCGSGLCEYGANAGANVYVFYGTLGKEGREALKPKGEFFTKLREGWCPEVPVLLVALMGAAGGGAMVSWLGKGGEKKGGES